MKMIGVCFRKLNVYIFVYLTKVSLSLSLSLFVSLTHSLVPSSVKSRGKKWNWTRFEALPKRFPFLAVNPVVTFRASKRRERVWIHSMVLFFFFTTNDKRLRTIAALHLSHKSMKISVWMQFATLFIARGAKHLATARNWFAADGVQPGNTWETCFIISVISRVFPAPPAPHLGFVRV